jgi:hypothetical protein
MVSRGLRVLILISLGVFVVLTISAPAAQAGPPLICWPFNIGDAKSLPFGGDGWRAVSADYDLRRLPEDTLALLGPSTPVIVRMETLRRATVYVMKDRNAAGALLDRLQARVRDAEAKGSPDALALFDAGYLAECYKQARGTWLPENFAGGLDGYAMIEKAIGLHGADGEMEFAAALASAGSSHRPELDAHLQRAVTGAIEGSLLAKNLVTHAHLFRVRASTLADLRAQVGHATPSPVCPKPGSRSTQPRQN